MHTHTRRKALVRRWSVIATCAFLVIIGLIGLAAQHNPAGAQSDTVLTVRIEDTISPVKVRVVKRAVARAQEAGAQLLIIGLDTPGGLYGSTREIVEVLLESPVPVAVFVSPRGAQAGSAGTFITAAAHIAAMAPGSNIGAATPVSGSGEEISETLADKVTNDAAALIRSVAEERGRNADALEETVRTAASYTATEALDAGIIDLIAEDVRALLASVDGQTVATVEGEQTLQVADAEVRELKLQWRERFVDFISNPNIAFLLLTLGSMGLIIEMLTPGAIGPGVAGIICLGLGFLALGNLPFNWAGVAFILLAVVLAALEIFVSGFGALGVGAAVSLVVGGLLLFGDFGGGAHHAGQLPNHISEPMGACRRRGRVAVRVRLFGLGGNDVAHRAPWLAAADRRRHRRPQFPGPPGGSDRRGHLGAPTEGSGGPGRRDLVRHQQRRADHSGGPPRPRARGGGPVAHRGSRRRPRRN